MIQRIKIRMASLYVCTVRFLPILLLIIVFKGATSPNFKDGWSDLESESRSLWVRSIFLVQAGKKTFHDLSTFKLVLEYGFKWGPLGNKTIVKKN